MKRALSVLALLTMIGVLTAPAGAGPLAPASSDRTIATSLAPPGSLNDGDALAAASLARLASQDDDQSSDPLPGQRHPWRIPRSSTDRADERTGRQLHFVYLVPAGMPDDQFDEKGIIDDSARAMNAWTKAETGNKKWRLDTFTFNWDDPETFEEEWIPINAVDVTFIKSSLPGASLNSVDKVDDELMDHGLNVGTKRYLTYVAANAGGVCGDAWWTLDPSAGPYDGKYSDVYLYSTSGCRARDFAPNATTPSYSETIAMQEMIHNDGIVAMTAPHNCVVSPLAYGHVCTGPLWAAQTADPENADVMFPYVGLPLNQKHLDTDHLDYYAHPFPTRDLEQGYYLEAA